MTSAHGHHQPSSEQAHGLRDARRAVIDAGQSLALHLAGRPARPEAARVVVDGAAAHRQARHHGGSLHLQMGNRCARRPRQRAGRSVRLAVLGARRAGRADDRLWRHAHPDGGAHANARRRVRQGRHARGAPARLPHLRAHARIIAALPSRAQDRRVDARARARPQRHRDHRAHGHSAACAHHHRAQPDRRRADVEIRLALRGRDHDHRRALYDLHLLRHRMAHRHPPQDERQRHRRQHQGDRLAAQLRDGEIFQRRGARSAALRQIDGALRGRQRQGLYFARGAQCRAGGVLHLRARQRHGAVRLPRSRPAPRRSAISC